MSRITKWKLEKTKVKVVFRLQFHATHIPQTGWDKLFISFIPTDSGKATGKTTKANVRSGTCKWADPIYESTRLLQDIKTKQFDEKFYKLVVAMGSSRASVLGEAHIDLAHYADALKPYVVALPLQGCDSGAILHVTVQLLTSKTGFREFEQQRELRERVFQTTSDESATRRISSLEDTITDPIDKVNARVRFKEGLPPLEEEVGLNEESADSAVGFDGSSSTSDSLYAEKHDTSNTHEVDSLKSITCGDLVGPSHSQSSYPEKGDPSNHRLLPQGSNDWPHGWGSEYSGDNDLANAYEENGRLRRSLEVAESSILELKQEVSSLHSHADEIGSEAQKFAQLLSAEIASGEELAKEVSVMRSECSNFKADLEQLKYSKLSTGFAMRGAIKMDRDHVSQELQQRWLKGLLDMEEKIRELQKNACFGFHERDVRFFNSDLEALLGVLQDLKQGTGQEVSGLNSVSFKENRGMTLHKDEQLLPGARFNAELYEPESLLLGLNIPPLVSQDNDSADVQSVMKEKIFVLVKELDDLKGEREGLARKMDQMECYYEALVQELEETQRQMMGELQSLRSEHSTSLYTISATKAEMEKMHQDMNNQIIRFSEEKSDLDSLNKVLERRAVTAEAALKRARLNYSIAVKQLQKDLEVLSFQVLSMYETNENLIKQAFSDSSLPRFPSQEVNTQNHKLDSKELHVAEQLSKCENVSEVVKKHSERDIISEDLKRSLLLQKGLHKKSQEEIIEVYLANVYLDVFSKALQETLLEASADFTELREKNNELTQQLELSNESKELLMLKLQTAMDEIHHLSQYKDTCEAKCNDLVLQNQVLETNFRNVTQENSLFSDKIAECEALLEDLRSYENKFKVCTEEKIELEELLKNKTLESEDLRNKVQEEINAVRTEFDGLTSSKDSLQSSVNFLYDKLQNLLAFYETKYKGLSTWSEDIFHGLESQDLAGIMLRLEELQHGACEMMFQLIKEKQDLLHEREMAQMSLDAAESDNVVIKQKFERDIQNILDKVDGSSILVQKLQSEVEAIANRLKISSEAEENYAQQHRELVSDFDLLEIKLQQLTSQNMDLAREITGLDSVSEELSRCKLAIAVLSEEKEALVINLNGKSEEAAKLEVEFNNLRSSLESELLLERSIRDKLESKVTDLAREKAALDTVSEELRKCKLVIVALSEEKEALVISLKDKSEESAKLEEEVSTLRSSLQSSRDELQVERGIGDELESRVTDLAREKEALDTVNEELRKCKLVIAALSEEKEALVISLNDKSEESAKLEEELDTLRSGSQSFCDELQLERGIRDELESKLTDLAREKAAMDTVSEELRKCKLAMAALSEEKEALVISLKDKSLESAKLEEEFNTLRSSSQSFCDELRVERDIRDELESKVTTLTSQLNEKHHELLKFDQQQAELVHLKQLLSNLELEKSQVSRTLLDSERSPEAVREECSSISCLEAQLSEMHELSVASDVRVTFVQTQYDAWIEELVKQLFSSDRHFTELQKKYANVESMLSSCRASEVHYIEENAKLMTSLNVLKSDLDASIAQNRVLLDKNSGMRTELEECKKRSDMEATFDMDKRKHVLEVKKMEGLLVKSEEKIDNLIFSKEELEVQLFVLKEKLDEQQPQIALLEEYKHELRTLQNKYNELTHRLSEQVLKTEEFKNLSIHLKELKDKADAECLQAREKRESEAPPSPMQESLRIAFIKEQYETKLQELKHQLAISKKHSEEMLWKLQDAIDEVENKKKSEASHLKRNEELGMRILELESELQSAISEKRELMRAYDLMKAEKECSSISLECCKEEKKEVEASLSKCNEEKSKIALELDLMKDLLESSESALQNQRRDNDGLRRADCQQVLTPINDANHSHALTNMQTNEDALVSGTVNGCPSQEDVPQGEMKHLALVNDHFKAQSLRSSMDHLHKELERMKHEDDQQFGLSSPDLEVELMQLQRVNKELGSIFPLFNEFPCNGNALERVLALEIELAEALRAKKKSSVLFQSSFLKQHSDEEAVFKSFRDINELIKDMLEIKGRYSSVETELKEMHDRYSQLSLQFAEVEGERQKLMMTLKNVRGSKKTPYLNRSSTAPMGGPLS